MILVTFPLDGSSRPLRNHLMVTGGVPVRILQSIVTSKPSTTYTGVPILTLSSTLGMIGRCGMNGPSSISGGTPNKYKL